MTNDDKDLKITSHLDPVFNKPEYKWLNTDALQRAFGEGNNYAVDRMRATPQQPSEPLKELDKEALCNFLDDWREQFRDWSPAKDVDRLCNLPAKTLSDAICSKFGQPSEKKSKAEAIHEAIRNADVGDDIVIHNEDMSVWCILNLVTREHPERESNGKDRS